MLGKHSVTKPLPQPQGRKQKITSSGEEMEKPCALLAGM
jgi:hypothetical protein